VLLFEGLASFANRASRSAFFAASFAATLFRLFVIIAVEIKGLSGG